MDDLQSVNRSTISELRDGARDIEITVQVENWQARTFTNADGEERTVRSGDVMDPTGRCRLTSWGEMNPEPGAFLHLKGARVQFWQGSPDLVIDSAEQVVDLSDPPWEAIDPTDHWVEVDLTDLVNGGSRRGIRTSGTVVAIANNSGIIERCPECRRVMRDGECAEHGPQRGEEDVRLRFVLDDGVSNASTLIGKEATEALTGMDQAQISDAIDANTRAGFIATLRERFLARKLHINGRAMVDAQGAILMADSVEIDTRTPEEAANEVMARWGVVL